MSASIVTTRVVVPVPSPLHPLNVDPAAVGALALAVAVRVTDVPFANVVLHVPLGVPFARVQLMPLGVLVTVPVPAPLPVIVSVRLEAVMLIVAEASVFELFPEHPVFVLHTLTVQVPA